MRSDSTLQNAHWNPMRSDSTFQNGHLDPTRSDSTLQNGHWDPKRSDSTLHITVPPISAKRSSLRISSSFSSSSVSLLFCCFICFIFLEAARRRAVKGRKNKLPLTHLPLVLHIFVSELCISNLTLRNKLQWNLNQNINFSFMKMHLNMSSVKSWPFCSSKGRWVKEPCHDVVSPSLQMSSMGFIPAHRLWFVVMLYGLIQKRCNSIADGPELGLFCQLCTDPSKCKEVPFIIVNNTYLQLFSFSLHLLFFLHLILLPLQVMNNTWYPGLQYYLHDGCVQTPPNYISMA